MTRAAPAAEELLDCNFAFAEAARNHGYATFEATIAPVVSKLSETHPAVSRIAPNRIAHVLVSAVRGFKQSAATPDNMRRLIDELLLLSFGPS